MEKKEEVIKEENRSKKSSEYNYGEIDSYDLSSRDIPKFAVIIYDDNGNIIYEDYSELDKYIENVIIKNGVRYKRVATVLSDDFDFEGSISLCNLVRCGFSELELKYVIEYLEARGIIVRGFNSTLDSEFGNYKFLSTYKSGRLPVHMSFEDQKEKFYTMRDDSLFWESRSEARDKLIEANIRLVPYVTYKYAMITGIDINELNSYGYEGLISAVDNFDVDLGYKFSGYAITSIRRWVFKGVSKILGFEHQTDLFSKYIMVKNVIESEVGESIYDNPRLIDLIVDEMIKIYGLSKRMAEGLKNQLLLMTVESFEDQQIQYDNMDEIIFADALIDEIENVMNNYLWPIEKEVLSHYYGLDGYDSATRVEIGKNFGYNGQRVRQIEEKALRKLKNPFINSSLKDYYEKN